MNTRGFGAMSSYSLASTKFAGNIGNIGERIGLSKNSTSMPVNFYSNGDQVSDSLTFLNNAINSRRKTATIQEQRSNSIGSIFETGSL